MEEIAADPELKGPYEEQSLWIEEVVAWGKHKNELELVIKVHPNLGRDAGREHTSAEIKFFEDLRTRLPGNIHMIMPEESINSYALMDKADIGFTFGSTAGIEMAMLGKPVLLAGRAFYENGRQILTVRSKQTSLETMERSLQAYRRREIQRDAFRLVYYHYFVLDLPFPLVSMIGWHDAKLNYTSLDALVPGQHIGLDRICDFLMYGNSLYPSPTEAEQGRSTADEDAFFEELESSSEPWRDLDYERWAQHITRLNRLSRSTQDVLHYLPFGLDETVVEMAQVIYRPFLHWMERRASSAYRPG
jgi:hypothetical protein